MKKIITLAGLVLVGSAVATGTAHAENPVAPALKPVASTQENNAALDNFSKITGAAATGGGLVGTGVGAVIGCIVTLPVCLPGLVTGAGIGGVVGTLAFGGPALVATGVDLAQTYMAEPGTTHWAVK